MPIKKSTKKVVKKDKKKSVSKHVLHIEVLLDNKTKEALDGGIEIEGDLNVLATVFAVALDEKPNPLATIIHKSVVSYVEENAKSHVGHGCSMDPKKKKSSKK